MPQTRRGKCPCEAPRFPPACSHWPCHSPAGAEGDKAGYRHASLLGPLLRGHRGPLVLASNSPSHHVLKVVRALGLADVAFQLLVTPDKIPGA